MKPWFYLTGFFRESALETNLLRSLSVFFVPRRTTSTHDVALASLFCLFCSFVSMTVVVSASTLDSTFLFLAVSLLLTSRCAVVESASGRSSPTQ